jgi:hypothetical protein
MQSIAKVERKKEIFKLTTDEISKGEWFEKIKEEVNKGNNVEFTYINSIFTLRTYFITEKENLKERESK